MLKELFIALKMAQAARELQSTLGPLRAIHVEVDESLEKVTAIASGDYADDYINYGNLEKYNYATAENIRTVWNYSFEHSNHTWETCVNADGETYEFGYWEINGVWFMVDIYE